MPGEPSETLSFSTGARPGRTLAKLRVLHRVLERDRDSHEAWSYLAGLFAAIDDRRRSLLCENIARTLRRLPAA